MVPGRESVEPVEWVGVSKGTMKAQAIMVANEDGRELETNLHPTSEEGKLQLMACSTKPSYHHSNSFQELPPPGNIS